MRFAFILLLIPVLSLAQTTKKVCFLGNSYTFYSDMPGIVASMATADGNTLIKDQNTPGGYTLNGHSTNATSLNKISADTWDYVVLQEQSQLPSFPWGQASTDCFPHAATLCDSIRSANECAIPIFFNTWGRLNGDPQWDSINTFDKMNWRLANAYGFMADQNSGMRAPVGIGFGHVDNDIAAPINLADLFSGDGSHPSVHGSYMAACIFYEIIFETSSQGNTHIPSGITAAEASYIQDVANHVINDVDSIEVDFTNPFANFSYTTNGLEVTFQNLSEHSFEWDWQFSDGGSSTDKDPIHTFTMATEFYATLTASYCGKSADTTIYINFPLGNTENQLPEFTLYPNPSNGQITISYAGDAQQGEIISVSGQFIKKIGLNESLGLDLPKGVYFIKVGESVRKLIIQ
jgi:hypothetical protein